LEIASWDSYPLGFLEDRSDQPDDFRHKFQRQGDPDFQAFHHDLYRSVGKGRWGIMEQQPGPVNWAPYNPVPLQDMVRLWSWEAVAHGAEFVNYFRWRQAPFAQEQMHSGLKRADNQPTTAYDEVKTTAQELFEVPAKSKAKIAIIFDYESAWAWHIQPQGRDFDYFRLSYEFYVGLRRLGQNIDIVPPHISDLSDYDYVIIPGLFTLNQTLIKTIRTYGGKVLLGPRADSKTENFQLRTNPVSALGLDISTLAIESLRPTERIEFKNGGQFKIWREILDSQYEHPVETYDGYPAIIRAGNIDYLCGWPDEESLITLYKNWLDLDDAALPDGLRRRDFGDYTLFTNYSAKPVRHNGLTIDEAGIKIILKKTNEIII